MEGGGVVYELNGTIVFIKQIKNGTSKLRNNVKITESKWAKYEILLKNVEQRVRFRLNGGLGVRVLCCSLVNPNKFYNKIPNI